MAEHLPWDPDVSGFVPGIVGLILIPFLQVNLNSYL
jgi:hypothetical protein